MHKLTFWFILISSIAALALAFFTEYVLGFPACRLCIYQRIPFVALIKLSLCGIFISKWRNMWTMFVALTLLSAIALAGYHTGVEHGVFEASTRCNPDIQMPDHLSILDIRDMLYGKSVATCTKPPFKVLRLSMTEWNLLFNIGLLVVVLLSFIQKRRTDLAKTILQKS